MLCIPIVGPRLGDVERQLLQAAAVADIAELRIDLFRGVTLDEVRLLKERFSVPMLFSLRSAAHGGAFKGTLAERCLLLSKLISLKPAILDVESDMPFDEVMKLKQLAPAVRLLASHHDLDGTRADLRSLLEYLQRLPTDQYKLVTFAHTTQDALRMMALTQEFNRLGGSLTGICMGSEGAVTRILAAQIGSPLLFCSLEETTASVPGQIPWREMLELYRFRECTPEAQRLGLIGTPVDKSPSHLVHNAIFHQLDLDALWVKMRVEPEELPLFVEALRALDWRGLAVTMPLKEKLIPFLDALDDSAAAIGAVNIVAIQRGKWVGYNTDGDGALDAIETQTGAVRGKRALVLGAGGAAKAVAWAAQQRGAEVSITNRTDLRAQEAAQHLGCHFAPWSQLQASVNSSELLLQSTSAGMSPAVEETLVEAAWLSPGSIVFDVVSRPQETRLLREAKARGCQVVAGPEMFVYQAARQIGIWFGGSYDKATLAAQYRRALAELAQ